MCDVMTVSEQEEDRQRRGFIARITVLESENADLRAQLSAQSVSAVQPVATAEEYLSKKYGGYRAHAEWRALEEAFNAGRAADADAVDAKRLQLIIDNAAIWLSNPALAHIMHKGITVRELIDAAIAAQSTEGAKG